MKKIITLITMIFLLALPVLAADNNNDKVTLKDIKLSNYELAPFEGVLEIDYELVPNDVEDKNITWTISGVQKGVVVEFKEGNKTNKAVGTIVLEVKNSNSQESSFKIIASSGKIVKNVSVKIEDKETTETRYKVEVVKQIESLIKEAKKIDKDNVTEIEKAINKIEVMLKNEEVKNSVNKDLLEDFNDIKDKLDSYKEDGEKDYSRIIVIAILVIAFLFGIYMIFKGNSPKKEEVKVSIKKEEPKKEEIKESVKKEEPKKTNVKTTSKKSTSKKSKKRK